MTNENKKSFFKELLKSIKDFEKYGEFAVEETKTSIKYLMKLVLIMIIVITSIYTYTFINTFNTGIEYFKNNIPDLEYNNGKLTVNSEESIILNTNSDTMQAVIIDTTENDEKEAEYKEKVKDYSTAIILLEDKLIIKNELLAENFTEYNYQTIADRYGISNFNKNEAIEYISKINSIEMYIIFYLVMLIYAFVVYFITILLDVIMLGILGYIIARISRMKIRFVATFRMAIHALSLPIILNIIYIIVNYFTGFTIQYFQWMYTTISYIYMIVAILIIRTDLINRQMELMKIVQEQENVRKEMEQEDNKEDENKKEEEEEKEKKDTKDNNGEEPEGSKA